MILTSSSLACRVVELRPDYRPFSPQVCLADRCGFVIPPCPVNAIHADPDCLHCRGTGINQQRHQRACPNRYLDPRDWVAFAPPARRLSA